MLGLDECIEHVPRASVLSLAAAVRKHEPDLIVTVGGGTPIDTVKVTLLTMAAGVTDMQIGVLMPSHFVLKTSKD